MAISRRKNRAGRVIGYTVTVVVPNARGGRGTRYVIGTFRTRRMAEETERKAKDQIQGGTFDPAPPEAPTRTTVADAVGIWIATKRGTVTANTSTIYEGAIRNHVLPALGGHDIAGLTHDDIQGQVNMWRDGGMGARLLHLCVMILRASLARQVKSGRLPFNPADGVEKPSARTRKQFTIWNDSQLHRFLTEAEQDRLAPVWFLTLLEGMRRGEAIGLRWRDLHWNADETACVATVEQTIVPDLAHGGAVLIQNRAKTTGSRRSVQLTSSTIRVLRAHRDRQRFARQALADTWGDHDLIATTSIGTPVPPANVKRYLADLIDRADVPAVNAHSLRHMAATTALRAGVSPALVAARLGHASIATTVDLYGHLAVTDQVTTVAAMEAAVTRSRDASTGTEDA